MKTPFIINRTLNFYLQQLFDKVKIQLENKQANSITTSIVFTNK